MARADIGVGIALLGLAAGSLSALVLLYRSLSVLGAASLVFTAAVTLLAADFLLARYRVRRVSRSIEVTSSGLRGELMPPGLVSVRGGIARVKTQILRLAVAKFPESGIPWSDLVVRISARKDSSSFVVSFYHRIGHESGGMFLFDGHPFMEVELGQLPRFVAKVLSECADLQLWIPSRIEFRQYPLAPFGTVLGGSSWLRLAPGLGPAEVRTLVSSLYGL
jgi:hypothetical protein